MSSGRISLLLLSMMVSLLACACVRPPEQPKIEQPPAPEAAQPQGSVLEHEEPQAAPKLTPPSAADVRNAITRMYKNAVLIDANRFCVGDFNGDGLQDVAVVVRPAEGSLEELNGEVANWILEDPQKVVLPDPTKKTQILGHAEPTKVEQSDKLLAILHGFGPAGWRDPRARQTYLLRNAAGTNMKTQQLADALRTLRNKEGLLKLRGDVINVSIAGEIGFLYYSGAKYAWHKTGVEKTIRSTE